MLDDLKALYSQETIQKLDQFAQEYIPAYELMCRAGEAAWTLLKDYWPEAQRIVIICGYGNNAGDGLVLARLAKIEHKEVQVFQVGTWDESKVSPHAKQARLDWLALGTTIDRLIDPLDADVVVDALLGTGFREGLSPAFSETIDMINSSGIPVLSLDLPSGLNPDTGDTEKCVHADVTVTFIAQKIGLNLHHGLNFRGDLYCANLDVNPLIYQRVNPLTYSFTYDDIKTHIPKRLLTAHKGSFGHTLIVGGGELGFSGAVTLAAEASLRSGSGLTSVVCAAESLPLMERGPQEMMCHTVQHGKEMKPLLEKATSIVLGPGLSQNPWAHDVFKTVVQMNKPLIVDADGLNLLVQYQQTKEQWILTPHPGEAARLLDVSVVEIQKDRVTTAKRIQEKWGGICILKGAGTIVATHDKVYICPLGVPALATGGTGDILAGLLGGLLSQGFTPLLACLIGVAVHMQAGISEQMLGSRGMLASDLFLHIRSLLNPNESS